MDYQVVLSDNFIFDLEEIVAYLKDKAGSDIAPASAMSYSIVLLKSEKIRLSAKW
jgi:hypothetical protein